MPDDSAHLPARYPNGRFGPGNPGRPVGSVNRASRRAALDVLEHFERHRDVILDGLANSDFLECRALYIKLLTRILPRAIETGPADSEFLSEAELAQAFSHARLLVDGQTDRRAALAEMEAVFLGERKK